MRKLPMGMIFIVYRKFSCAIDVGWFNVHCFIFDMILCNQYMTSLF